ncbi:MAG: enhanced serine sensitivity protein SseB C-terminal domain-containing protein [Nocardiopsaceae bacterium]|nr:enhanced serine sensitivity protein SseB C-terminal domain-containing protein [Nocardiopsaceae bacterium]
MPEVPGDPGDPDDPDRPAGADAACEDAACEAVEKALAAMAADDQMAGGDGMAGDDGMAGGDGRARELLGELARARVLVPLPTGPHPVTDGSAVVLPVVTYLGAEFVPCFTSAERLALFARSPLAGRTAEGPSRRAADARPVPHIAVPATALARQLPPGLGMALNPGAEQSLPIGPDGVAYLAGNRRGESGGDVRVGHPPAEPDALLREVERGLAQLPDVIAASRAWLSVPGAGEGLVFSVTLEDPACEAAHANVVGAIERAVASVPQQPGYPIDVTFPGEAAPDLVDEWVAAHAPPFYTREGRDPSA